MKFPRPAAIVDFLYHPKATFWFDHHLTTFMYDEWKEEFKPTTHHVWESTYPSGCGLVIKSLKKNFGYKPPAHIVALGKIADIVDAAKFTSARQAVEAKGPLVFHPLIDFYHDKSILNKWHITHMSERPLTAILREPKLKKIIAGYRVAQKKLLSHMKKNLVVDGKISLFDYTALGSVGGEVRFIPYYLYPKVIYAVRVKQLKPGFFRVAIGHNPWSKEKHAIHIGKFLRERYGGGGHKVAGGGEFKMKAEAKEAGWAVVGALREYVYKEFGKKLIV
jgi:oligoribonuclease NrnB/cAMP/cGMP phosphodiesterase (DHH superfamily)